MANKMRENNDGWMVRKEKEMHIRAIDGLTENGCEEETRDNREENSFLLVLKRAQLGQASEDNL